MEEARLVCAALTSELTPVLEGPDGWLHLCASARVHPQQSCQPAPVPASPDLLADLPACSLAVRAVKAALDCGQDLHALQLRTPVQAGCLIR